MSAFKGGNRLRKSNAEPLALVFRQMLQKNGIGRAVYVGCVFSAWDEASGAAQYTSKKFFSDGKLYITLNSSVVRSRLSFQKTLLIERINALLADNPLFPGVAEDGKFVKEIILK